MRKDSLSTFLLYKKTKKNLFLSSLYKHDLITYLGHNSGFFFVFVDGNRSGVDPRGSTKMSKSDIWILGHQGICPIGQGGRIQLEKWGQIVGVRNRHQVIHRNIGPVFLTFEFGSHGIVWIVIIHFGSQVLSRCQVFESKQGVPMASSTPTRVMLDNLYQKRSYEYSKLQWYRNRIYQ